MHLFVNLSLKNNLYIYLLLIQDLFFKAKPYDKKYFKTNKFIDKISNIK